MPVKPGDIMRLKDSPGFRRVLDVSANGETVITEACIPCGFVFNPDYRTTHVMELLDAQAEWDAIEARARFVAEAQASMMQAE